MKTAVIITNYNQGRFAGTAIKSIQSQTVLPDQCIIVDDCSTDNSIELIKKEIKSSSLDWKLVKRATNGKPAGCRNAGIQALNDDIEAVAFLDVDDWYQPTKVEESIKVLQAFPSVGLVYSDYLVYDQVKNVQYREYKHQFRQEMLEQACIVSTNSVIRRDTLRQVGFFNPKLYGVEDYEMWLRLTMISDAYHVSEPLFVYRQHGENLTAHHANYMQAQLIPMRERLKREGHYVSAE